MSDVYIDPAKLDRYVNSPTGPVAKELLRYGVKVETEAKRSLHQPGTGRVYVLRNPRRVHRASAPGQPAATDLGTLAGSVIHRLGTDTKGLFCSVGTPLKKGRWLELGTRRMRPRPFLRRALRAIRGGRR